MAGDKLVMDQVFTPVSDAEGKVTSIRCSPSGRANEDVPLPGALDGGDDPGVAVANDGLSARLAVALDVERIHGDGSLIDLADTVVDNLVRRELEITLEQVAAANRHRHTGADGAPAPSAT